VSLLATLKSVFRRDTESARLWAELREVQGCCYAWRQAARYGPLRMTLTVRGEENVRRDFALKHCPECGRKL
jgi:hypothetical protein